MERMHLPRGYPVQVLVGANTVLLVAEALVRVARFYYDYFHEGGEDVVELDCALEVEGVEEGVAGGAEGLDLDGEGVRVWCFTGVECLPLNEPCG